jgi:hypothetical protein
MQLFLTPSITSPVLPNKVCLNAKPKPFFGVTTPIPDVFERAFGKHYVSPSAQAGLRDAFASNPAVPNALLENNHNRLFKAASQGRLSTVDSVLRGVQGSSNQGAVRDALQAASRNGRTPVVERLLSAPANIGSNQGAVRDALQAASRNGRTPVVERLLSAPANIGSNQGAVRDALQAASRNGRTPVVERLLSAPANIGSNQGAVRDAFHAASSNGHTPVVERLNKEVSSRKIQRVFRGFRSRKLVKSLRANS